MTASSVRFAVVKDGRPRCILSIAERKNSDLILNPRALGYANDDGIPFAAEITDRNQIGDLIRELRYSVHMSPESKIGVNTIKLHHILADGTTKTQVQYASAIKQTNNFTPIYARLCTTLDAVTYDVKKNGKFESLGEILAPFTLVFAVFLGSANRVFKYDGRTFQTHQVFFREFSIVMLWCYLTSPPTDASKLLSTGTTPGFSQSEGYDERSCVDLFDIFRSNLKARYVEMLEKEPEMAQSMRIVRASTFLREARTDTQEYRDWGRWMVANKMF